MGSQSDMLIIGYDLSNGKDMSCLVVSRCIKGVVTAVNIFYGEEADVEYRRLTTIG